MSDRAEWFAPKRYGYGAGLPIAWQGWAVLAAFLAYCFVVSTVIDKPGETIALVVPAAVAFVTVVAKTTRGGWRWRWGERD